MAFHHSDSFQNGMIYALRFIEESKGLPKEPIVQSWKLDENGKEEKDYDKTYSDIKAALLRSATIGGCKA